MVGESNGVLAVLLGVLTLLLVVAVHRRNGAAIVNALVSLVLALCSVFVAGGFQSPWLAVDTPALPLWVTVAGLLHSVGMLGPYESVWWWDHLTHTVSAALVAALLYAGLVVAVATDAALTLSPLAIAVTAVVYTFLVGVFWELVELVARAVGKRYGIEPVLVHYGWRDTAFDLAFDLVGALVVVALDVRVFVALAERFPDATQALLAWTGGVVTVGSVVIALGLYVESDG
ncbi:hypothetical protein [Haloarcula sp. JP-L23]|uniref:hypothetical protein n=1 Tax=Haloarcula sp. JP-L23 TaxID=2716717 RepID=UPI00140F0E27|nr:hypothetical protein G9465_18095 [Haloarcula sp. JP-L23]